MIQKSVYIYTFGCQMNVHDSEKMLGVLFADGYTAADSPEHADLILFNTCAIREKAEQKFYSQLGRTKLLKKRRPDLKIAVAGCVAQDAKDRLLKRAPYVDFVLGPQNIHLLNTLAGGSRNSAFEENPQLATRDLAVRRQGRTKAWVSIMYGCNNYCSYCIVPYTRGREVSRPSGHILSEILELRESGFREVTLLGQNVNSYRSDCDFPELLQRISEIGMPRVRFVTSHPRDLSQALIRVMAAQSGICEHLHLPLQSGSDRVLAGMNRGYTLSAYKDKVSMIREQIPSIALTSDIIAGFPGETEQDHEDTLRALDSIGFDGIFAFKFSPRKGTKAFGMEGQLEEEVKSARLDAILKLQERITLAKNATLVGSSQELMIDGPSENDPNLLSGRTSSNKIVTLPACELGEGDFVSVRIERARLHSLEGVPIHLKPALQA